jgi:glycosyltransferase involved in cell wall biosynthesis
MTERRTVVVDARMLGYPLGGIGRYAFELLRCLTACADADWVLLSHAPVPPALRERLSGPITWIEGTGSGSAELWMQRRGAAALRARRDAMFLGLANSVPFAGPRSVRYALVVYDLTFLAVPLRTQAQDLVKGFLVNVPAILRADLLLAISGSVQTELQRWLPGRQKRVVTLPPGGSKLTREETPPPFQSRSGFLAVGAHPRKNTGLLLRAYARLPAPTRRRHPLYLVARNLTREIATEIARLGLNGDVRLRQHGSDAELGRLYAGCVALVYPSAYEGLGLPVAEALLAGLPAIVPARSPMSGFLGEGGIVLDRLEEPELAAAMSLLAGDEARWRACSVGALRSATTISWDRVGTATRDLLQLPSRG